MTLLCLRPFAPSRSKLSAGACHSRAVKRRRLQRCLHSTSGLPWPCEQACTHWKASRRSIPPSGPPRTSTVDVFSVLFLCHVYALFSLCCTAVNVSPDLFCCMSRSIEALVAVDSDNWFNWVNCERPEEVLCPGQFKVCALRPPHEVECTRGIREFGTCRIYLAAIDCRCQAPFTTPNFVFFSSRCPPSGCWTLRTALSAASVSS